MKNEQQSQNLLLKVDPRSTFRNNFLQPATNVFVPRQVDHARWKTGNIDENLQRNNVAQQVEGFCISYFAAFRVGPYREKLWPRSWKCCPRTASGSIFKPKVTVFPYYGPTLSRRITFLSFSLALNWLAYKWVCLRNFAIETVYAPSTNHSQKI